MALAYDVHKLTIDQLAEELQTVLEGSEDSYGWMTLRDIVEELDLEDDQDAVSLVKQTLTWMLQHSLIQRTTFGNPKLYRLSRLG